MSKILRYLPELAGDEQLVVAQLFHDLTEEQAEHFARLYRLRRKEPSTVLLLTLLGLISVGGVGRFYLGQVGMGLLYFLTGGLCLVGTVVDAFRHRALAEVYNARQAEGVYALVRASLPGRADPPALPEPPRALPEGPADAAAEA